jgi:hypothetical protein
MKTLKSLPSWRNSALLAIAIATLAVTAVAQKYTAPSNPVIGSQNTVTADPPLARPSTTPCVVPLFNNYVFADFSSKTFNFVPPSCPGPWAKVILETDFSISAGRQYDRTANIWIGGVNVYFGTTAEPSAGVSRSWHTESDLTDYSPLFTAPQNGRVDLGNLVNSTYTGILYGSAQLQFYPLEDSSKGHHDDDDDAPRAADIVLPLSGGPTGGTVGLGSPASSLTRTFTLPTNVERAYLDVIAQSQSNDEFWYTCVPSNLGNELQSCGATAFRETDVYIDGASAGVAPVYPWIYTGGIDPYLWRPIVGIQTLNFVPYRVDLTPFAGQLSDGTPHTVSLKVFNANNYFSTTATLLVYQDHGSTQVTGMVTANTIGSANPAVTTNIATDAGGNITGTVGVTSSRDFKLAGFVNTSHGKVDTQLTQQIGFANNQQFNITADGNYYAQSIVQNTQISSNTVTKGKGPAHVTNSEQQWPLSLAYDFVVNPDGSAAQTTTVSQAYTRHDVNTAPGGPAYVSDTNVTNAPADTLVFGATTYAQNQSGKQRYQFKDNRGACWDRTITAASGALTSVTDGCKKK